MAPRLARPALLAVPLAVALGLSATATAEPPPPGDDAGSAGITISAPGDHVDTADELPSGAVVADERIYQVVRAGDRVYGWGNFSSVGRYSGPGGVLDATTGAAGSSPQIMDGQVSVTVPDGAGGWFIGGDFTRIGAHQAGGLAHVLASGELDTDFLPRANHLVSALALHGDTLYVGGAFSQIGGAARERLAALSAEDGTVLPFAAPQSSRVTELLVPEDGPDRLLVASDKLHSLDLVTGAPTPGFSPATQAPITALAEGDGLLYVGASDLVAIDPTTGSVVPAFDLGETGPAATLRGIHTLVHTADRLYVGGDRTTVGGPLGLVAVDPDTGAVDPTFAPQIAADRSAEKIPVGVYDLALDGDRLWAGGSFTGGLAVVDSTTGAAVDLDLPAYNLQVNAVDRSGAKVYVGGHFFMVDAVHTERLAAFDAETLEPVPGFSANADSWGDLFVGAGALWVAETHFWGYDPDPIGDEYYTSWTSTVAAHDLDTGARIPARSMRVKDLTGITTIGDRLYVARRLQNDVPFPRNRVDVYDKTGTRVDTFLLGPRGYITQLTSLGGDLIVAGSFIGSKRYWTSGLSMLRLNPMTGKPRAYFDPHTNGPVYDVAVSRGGLVATGLFTKITDWFSTTRRPGITRMDDRSVKDVRFKPRSFRGNKVLTRVVPMGDLLWVSGSPEEFLVARTGQPVQSPLDWAYPTWVTGTADHPIYTSSLSPNLGGRTFFTLGFVASPGDD